MTQFQRVTLYAEDMSHRKFQCYFSCKKSLDNFVKLLNSLDHNCMEWDLWDTEDMMLFNYPLIPGNRRGLEIAMRRLYPNMGY
jgi:hypothetical protein